MKIKSKLKLSSSIIVFLLTVTSVICLYLFLPLKNPRTFIVSEFVVWFIVALILGFIILIINIVLLKRIYLSQENGILFFRSFKSFKKIEINKIVEIKVNIDLDVNYIPLININSADIKISFLENLFDKSEVLNFLNLLIKNNPNILLDETTGAYLADKDYWVFRKSLYFSIMHIVKVGFGLIIIVIIILVFADETLKLLSSVSPSLVNKLGYWHELADVVYYC